MTTGSDPASPPAALRTAAPLSAAAARLVDRLRGATVAAVLTPMDAAGAVQLPSVGPYAARLLAAGIGGLAVWAHTGRGPYLSPADQDAVLSAFRGATDKPVVAGVGVRPDRPVSYPELLAAYRDRAARAAAGGADALMVFPAAALRELPDREDRVLELHAAVADAAGLPLVAFVLHAEAGGYPYSLSLLRRLLARPDLAAVKLATLDSAMTCQDATWLVREEFPDRLVLTGEDRMFGPSLAWGAQGALVGIASALPELSVALVDAWCAGDHAGFVVASTRIDQLARVTFRSPMEGYVRRMGWLAAATGLIPAGHGHDPFGPPADPGERDVVLAVGRRLAAVPRRVG